MFARWTVLFKSLGLSELWVSFGSENNYYDISVHTIYSYIDIGPEKSLALPLFHSLTGSDTTSHLLGCGKKPIWVAWNSIPDLTATQVALMYDLDLDSIYMQQIERFIVLIYSKVCGAANVLLLHHWKQIAGKHPTYLR